MRVTVVYSPAPRLVREWELMLPEGATAAQALAASGLFLEFPEVAHRAADPAQGRDERQAQRPGSEPRPDEARAGALALSVWGRLQAGSHVLRDQDRVEVLRPLRVDPKVARRERFSKQGTRAAGLFSRGRKPG